jgi:hypothetical protein
LPQHPRTDVDVHTNPTPNQTRTTTALLDRETGLPLVVSFYNTSYSTEAAAARTEFYRDVRLGVPVDPALFAVPGSCVLGAEDEVR